MGFIPSLLKQRFGASEVVVTRMGPYIATLLLSIFGYDVWKKSSRFLMNEPFPEAAILGTTGSTSTNW